MALISCRECEKEISDQANACPHCGAPTIHGRAAELLAEASASARAAPRQTRSVVILGLLLLSIWAGPALYYGAASPCGMLRNGLVRLALQESGDVSDPIGALGVGLAATALDARLAQEGQFGCVKGLFRLWSW